MWNLVAPAVTPRKTLAQMKAWGHQRFDRLWLEGWMTREEAYVWLASALGVSESDVHFSMLDEDGCGRALSAVRRKLKHLRQRCKKIETTDG